MTYLAAFLLAVAAFLAVRKVAALIGTFQRSGGIANIGGAGAKVMAMLYRSDPSLIARTGPIDWSYLDDVLARLDRGLSGQTQLLRPLMDEAPHFNAELARAMREDPKQAMARAVFFPSMQAVSYVPVGSSLGDAIRRETRGALPSRTGFFGEGYASWDLYAWFRANAAAREYASYPLMEDWAKRPRTVEKIFPAWEKQRAT